jgi:hypothetical protein
VTIHTYREAAAMPSGGAPSRTRRASAFAVGSRVFDYRDAAIGAGIAIFAVALLGASVLLVGRARDVAGSQA